MPALTSGRYHIKWTQLANLPAPMYHAYVTVQDKKVYVAGGDSPFDDAKHQVYVYDVNTDYWNQLPPSGHYAGVPHIIGGKLAIMVEFCLLLGRKLIKFLHLMKLVKLGHLIILTFSRLEVYQGWLLTWSMLLLLGDTRLITTH